MNILTRINKIKWKYVIGANMAVVILAGVFATMQPAVNPTDNRSQAAEPIPTPLIQFRLDPANPPELLNPDPDWAKIGDAILIKGKNLGRVPFGTLYIGNIVVPYPHIIEWQPDHIVFTVPPEAQSAPVMLKTTTTTNKQLDLKTTQPLQITTTNK